MKVTVCLPTLQAAGLWGGLWASLEMQTLRPSEVIVIDSASTDGTATIARAHGCRVVSIERAEFRHGGTRQYAAELASGADVIVYVTQDLVLADAHGLARLVAAFDDASVGAAYGRQLPRPGASAIEAHARIFNYPRNSGIRSVQSVGTLGFKAIFFSNSFGAYRNCALKEVGGFPRSADFGEDTVVAARILKGGWHLAYVATACAYHSHSYSYSEEFRRYFKIGQLHAREAWLLREFGRATGEGRRFVMSEMRYLAKHAPWKIPDAIARTGMKYVAYQRGRRSSGR